MPKKWLLPGRALVYLFADSWANNVGYRRETLEKPEILDYYIFSLFK
jgi:hypothetical protein